MSTTNDFNSRLYARGVAAGSCCGGGTAVIETKRDPMRCKPEPAPCVDCGVLRCLCRPRFFAGQLLTEKDLNGLDTYIREKNRLHALQLHGAGVVNGLIVECDPCGKGVRVGCGYAVSPCGDDIVVCEATFVDLCALIKKCRDPVADCAPYQSGARARGDCDDLVEEWVLAIRYAERPARGVTALKRGGCGGGCGSGASCRCADGAKAAPRGAPAECEPTVICEGYSFDAFRAPSRQRDPKNPRRFGGELVERFYCCVLDLRQSIPPRPGLPSRESFVRDRHAWYLWCCQAKAALLGYLETTPGADCEAIARLQMTACPSPDLPPESFVVAMEEANATFTRVVIDALLGCLCRALLPPCPQPAEDDRLPLATIRVRRRDCAVLSICNFTPLRRQVLTFPNLEYWLGFLPVREVLADLLGRLCCGHVERPQGRNPDPATGVQPGISDNVAVSPDAARAARAAHNAETAMLRLNPGVSAETDAVTGTVGEIFRALMERGRAPLDPGAFLGSVLDFDDPGQKHALAEAEVANLPLFLLLNLALRPLAGGGEAAKVDGGTSTTGAKASREETAGGGSSAEMEEMRSRVVALEATVARLSRRPKAAKARRGGHK